MLDNRVKCKITEKCDKPAVATDDDGDHDDHQDQPHQTSDNDEVHVLVQTITTGLHVEVYCLALNRAVTHFERDDVVYSWVEIWGGAMCLESV